MTKTIHPAFSGSILEGVARILGHTTEGLTGNEIERFLIESKLIDIDPTNTKWKRIYNSFVDFQNRRQTSINILTFIVKSMSLARYVGESAKFELMRNELNQRLCFAGIEINESGKFKRTDVATTLSEAEQRANRLIHKLQSRNTHELIFIYCKAELLTDNYFHTVFESTKSIAETIRQKTGLSEYGSELIDKAFGIKSPFIRINDLDSETKESEHKGFANLIKGLFGMFRNTTSHSPKIIWDINEEDALDMLSTVSMIHRRLESATPIDNNKLN